MAAASVVRYLSFAAPAKKSLRRGAFGCINRTRLFSYAYRWRSRQLPLLSTCFCVQVSNNTPVDSPISNIAISPNLESDEGKWTVKMLYDGDCPLCMREVNMLRERNQSYKAIKFVDISAKDYSPEGNGGIDFATAMGRIHAILRDGSILYDIAAFKKLYEEVGLGWVYSFTKFEPLAKIADAVYSVWAKYRLPITGRPPLIRILEERQRKNKEACDTCHCRID